MHTHFQVDARELLLDQPERCPFYMPLALEGIAVTPTGQHHLVLNTPAARFYAGPDTANRGTPGTAARRRAAPRPCRPFRRPGRGGFRVGRAVLGERRRRAGRRDRTTGSGAAVSVGLAGDRHKPPARITFSEHDRRIRSKARHPRDPQCLAHPGGPDLP